MNSKHIPVNKIKELCKAEDIIFVGLFGSFARGEFTADSDIDLLVRFSKGKSLLDIVRIERELSAAFDRKVDLLTEASISPYLREKIKHELEVIYEGSR